MKRPKHIAEAFKISRFQKQPSEDEYLHDYMMQDIREASGFSEAARSKRYADEDPDELNFD